MKPEAVPTTRQSADSPAESGVQGEEDLVAAEGREVGQ